MLKRCAISHVETEAMDGNVSGGDMAKLLRKIVTLSRSASSRGAFTRRVREAALLVDETNYDPELDISELSLEQTRRIRSCRGFGIVKFRTKFAQ
jgi:hypothetical protein